MLCLYSSPAQANQRISWSVFDRILWGIPGKTICDPYYVCPMDKLRIYIAEKSTRLTDGVFYCTANAEFYGFLLYMYSGTPPNDHFFVAQLSFLFANPVNPTMPLKRSWADSGRINGFHCFCDCFDVPS